MTMYELAERLWPIPRSLTGDGVRETLRVIGEEVPELKTFEVPSGTRAFDWTVPKEWRIREAWIEDANGRRVVDFADSALHVVGYSAPIDLYVELDELKRYIFVEESDPGAVPYVTSYYKERSGFCMTKDQRDALAPGRYHIYIDSELFDGSLTYGEAILPGESEREVMFSTYICHPNMANDELSGPCVATEICRYLKSMPRRRLSYRIVFIPETIGSIVYISRHLDELRRRVAAGFVLSCVGDERAWSIVHSRRGGTLADRVLTNVLRSRDGVVNEYPFLSRGSDERQYCAPGIDLPFVAFCRSKYGTYPEYHTSRDDLELISQAGLEGSFEVMRDCIEALEHDAKPRVNCLCEPQLGKRGLYPNVSKKGSYDAVKAMTDFIAYADGSCDLIEISDLIGVPVRELIPIMDRLMEAGLVADEGAGI